MEEKQSKAKPREITPAPKPESTKHLRVLSNGVVYDTIKGRIVSSKNATTKITPERSIELQSKWQEKKREAMVRAANAVAEQGGGVDGRELKGDLAFVEAITESMTMKALSVNDPKAVDAARFVFQETGISEAQQQAQPPAQQPGAPTLILLLAQLHERNPGVIEGLVTESPISVSNNDAHSIVDGEVSDNSPTDQEPAE